MPPPAEGFASRLVLGPALRAQPDRRLVTLVREGYEVAFEEIVRRYAKPLARYAGAIVGARAEDVTQDAFSKALQALRRDDDEIDLRPWLYRIVRNTALNDLRDRPEEAEALAESIAGGRTAAEEAEQRERLSGLIAGLRALPEPQRAAIVMRELEGLSHEEIAAALGLSGGGARQAIYRARQALRDGAALILPLPFVRFLSDHSGDAATAGVAGGAGGAVVAATGASGASAGAGGVALKAGVVAAVLAGSVGTGVALRDGGGGRTADASPPATRSGAPPAAGATPPPALSPAALDSSDDGPGDDRHGDDDRSGPGGRGEDERGRGGEGRRHGEDGRGHGRHRRRGRSGDEAGSRPPGERHGGPRPERERERDRSGPGGGDGERLREDDRLRTGSSGPGPGGEETESRSGPGDGGSTPPPPEEEDRSGSGDGGGDSSGSGSGSGGSDDGSSNSGPGSDDSRDLEP